MVFPVLPVSHKENEEELNDAGSNIGWQCSSHRVNHCLKRPHKKCQENKSRKMHLQPSDSRMIPTYLHVGYPLESNWLWNGIQIPGKTYIIAK